MENAQSSSLNAALMLDALIHPWERATLVWPGSPRDRARLRLEEKERRKREAGWKQIKHKAKAERERFVAQNNL